MAGQVQGKVALVTGGASGIGEAVCELLAREGASVAVTDVDDLKGPEVAARIKKAGGEASFWHHDVTSEERWIEVVAEVMKRYGRLDVLVANAGIGIAVPSITQMSLADWRRQTAINLDGVFLSVKHGLPAMRKTGGGSVIMMSSLAGLRGSAEPVRLLRDQGRRAAVCESDRDGMRHLRRRHPRQLGASRHHRHADLGQDPDGGVRRRAKRADRSRGAGEDGDAAGACRARPIEIAQGVLYLASDASRYVTGTELVIDGGMNAGGVVRR